jgi:hypothetical protein
MYKGSQFARRIVWLCEFTWFFSCSCDTGQAIRSHTKAPRHKVVMWIIKKYTAEVWESMNHPRKAVFLILVLVLAACQSGPKITEVEIHPTLPTATSTTTPTPTRYIQPTRKPTITRTPTRIPTLTFTPYPTRPPWSQVLVSPNGEYTAKVYDESISEPRRIEITDAANQLLWTIPDEKLYPKGLARFGADGIRNLTRWQADRLHATIREAEKIEYPRPHYRKRASDMHLRGR